MRLRLWLRLWLWLRLRLRLGETRTNAGPRKQGGEISTQSGGGLGNQLVEHAVAQGKT
jgi:hypothetical protein